MADSTPFEAPADDGWTLLTNHARVLICLHRDPRARLRDLAERVGITERAVHRLVAQLEEVGVVSRIRAGRRNYYRLHLDRPLPHPLEQHRTVRELLDWMTIDEPRSTGS